MNSSTRANRGSKVISEALKGIFQRLYLLMVTVIEIFLSLTSPDSNVKFKNSSKM